ncbi:MAG: rhomboid family intramembrane serine protease [Rhizobiaceae bacterium]|nr:rhomboid family intramembrane serine protease [Rhizobiaceae bacterium]
MFIPLHDANSLRYIRLQYVTIGLIVANILVFLLVNFQSDQFVQAAVLGLGYIPSVVFDTAELPPNFVIVPEDMTYLTYSFLHGDIFHLGGNMLFLWVFGDNVEDALGHFRYLMFYLVCAAAGALVHGLFIPDSQIPLIGASGAIAGIVAAYLMLHPRVKVWVLAFGRLPLRIPAWFALAGWVGMQFGMFLWGGEEQVSFAAHIGGILAGAVLVLVLRRRGVPLFDQGIVTPQAVELEHRSAVRPVPAAPPPRWGRQ